jgi:hypothetical protein
MALSPSAAANRRFGFQVKPEITPPPIPVTLLSLQLRHQEAVKTERFSNQSVDQGDGLARRISRPFVVVLIKDKARAAPVRHGQVPKQLQFFAIVRLSGFTHYVRQLDDTVRMKGNAFFECLFFSISNRNR